MKQMIPFDYSSLSSDEAREFRTAAERINVRFKRTWEDVVEIGRELLTVKERLPHGKFGSWLKAECDFNMKTAQRFMQVAEMFGGKIDKLSLFKPAILYFLSAPSTPEAVRQAVFEKAEQGESVSLKEIHDLKAEVLKQAGLQPDEKQFDIFQDQHREVTVDVYPADGQEAFQAGEKAEIPNEPVEILPPDSDGKALSEMEKGPRELPLRMDVEPWEVQNGIPVKECYQKPSAASGVEPEHRDLRTAIDAAQHAMESLAAALASFESEPDEEAFSKLDALSQTLAYIASDIQSFIEPRIEVVV